ncbi:hypothetical protein GWK47_041135 [Chionoecetes opilio]|uniref:Uncharacterized protein n=1 Tax=Chionoecetes opilio TaxID=41210 RepID=A0A8J4YA67_CHIOP|nr:hypothetical protein GWK47_041135 [Chionoecetes opilio]
MATLVPYAHKPAPHNNSYKNCFKSHGIASDYKYYFYYNQQLQATIRWRERQQHFMQRTIRSSQVDPIKHVADPHRAAQTETSRISPHSRYQRSSCNCPALHNGSPRRLYYIRQSWQLITLVPQPLAFAFGAQFFAAGT